MIIPVEVVDYYLRYFVLPSKRQLFELGALSREFLDDLTGPDGGLCELAEDSPAVEAGGDEASESGSSSVAASP